MFLQQKNQGEHRKLLILQRTYRNRRQPKEGRNGRDAFDTNAKSIKERRRFLFL